MICEADRTLAEHEAAHGDKPHVLVRALGYQPGLGSLPGRMLFNVAGGEYAAGSTVTIETLLAQGYRVEVVQ
jgi:hypothetical protein